MQPTAIKSDYFDLQWDQDIRFNFYEDENAYGMYAYGTIEAEEFAKQANDYDRLCGELDGAEVGYTADDVHYGWAVGFEEHGELKWTRKDVTKDTEGAFPIAWINR